MAILLSEAIKVAVAFLITFGLSFVLLVSAHESDEHAPTGSVNHALSHEIESESKAGKGVSVAESVHGHSHDGFNHDHAVEIQAEQTIRIEKMAVTIAPDDAVSTIYASPVFEIDIPPRRSGDAALSKGR